MAMELCWCPLSAWLSPGAALFVFFNVLVGAIAFLSREQQPGGAPAASRHRLRRSSSSVVLDRLRSFSMFPIHPAAECYYNMFTEAERPLQDGATAQEPAVQVQATMAPPIAPALTMAEEATTAAMSGSEKDGAEAEDMSATLNEANVQGQQQHAAGESPPAPAAAATDEAIVAVESARKKKPRKVAPRRSKRLARASGQEEKEVEGKEELNARADLFIRQFREDLKLQRLNSIINYTRALRYRAGAASEQN